MAPITPATIAATLRRALLVLYLTTTFVTTCYGGAIGVYLALAAALASLIFTFDRPYLAAALRDWGVRAGLGAFFILWLAFWLSARNADDPMAFVDFLALPVVIPAFALLARWGGPERLELVSRLAAIGGCVAFVVGLVEVRLLHFDRAMGNTSPIFFSDMSALLASFSLLGLVTPRPRWRWLHVIGHGAALAALVAGGTRGALIGYGAGLVLFLGYMVIWGQGKWRDRLLLPLLGVGLGVAVSLTLLDVSRMLSLAQTVGEIGNGVRAGDESAVQRLAFWQGGIGAFLDSPIYGNGWWRRASAAVPFMPEKGQLHMTNDSTSHLHNDIINFASAAGLMGIGAYLLLMAAPVISAVRARAEAGAGPRLLAAGMLSVSYLTFGLTDTMFVFEVPKSMFILVCAVTMGFLRPLAPAKS